LLIVASLGLGLLVGLGAVAWLTRGDDRRELTYGEFKARLIQGEIQSARIGPAAITGTFRSGGLDRTFTTSRIGLENDTALFPLLDRHIPAGAYSAQSPPNPLRNATMPLLVAAVLGVGLWLVYRRAAPGSAMAFAKSRHKVYDKSRFQVTFEDVAGIDEAVSELREVVDYLRTPEKFRALGGRIPKGVLLVGPPGTGKTLLAKAVAGEADVPFFSLSGSDFMEMYVGVGAARVRSLFAQAEAQAPCLIFIDEIDAIGKARGNGGNSSAGDERDQTLNAMLVAMDGFDAAKGVIVMAATNRPETLDAALVRPGRFDRNVTVDRPDVAGRERILQVHVRDIPLGSEIDLRQIAAITSGFVGADLANLVNEAALLAARKGKQSVDRDEFEEGVERLIAGPQKKQRVVRPEELRRIAVHEAGHALVSLSLPDTEAVHKVTILGRGSAALGYTMYRPEDDRFLHTQSWLRHRMCGLLGGTIAEELVYGEFSDGATSDLQRVTDIARRMVTDFGMSPKLGRVSYQTQQSAYLPGGSPSSLACSETTAREIELEVRRLIDEALEQTRQILTARRPALDELTEELMVKETIDADELDGILERHPYQAA
jgi:cell division protease FtsH